VNFGPLTTKFSCLMLTHKNELLACSQANAFSTAHLPLLRDEFQTPKSSLYCSLTYGAGRHHPKLWPEFLVRIGTNRVLVISELCKFSRFDYTCRWCQINEIGHSLFYAIRNTWI